MKQFNITITEKVGALAEVCAALRDVNILALATEVHRDEGGTATVRIVTNNEVEARNALTMKNLTFTEDKPIVVDVIDKPGQLSTITQMVADAGININSLYLLDRGLFSLTAAKSDRDKVKEILADRIVED